MKPWITEELKQYDDFDLIQTREVFSFQINRENEFRWNSGKNGLVRITVEVFG